MRQRLAFFIRAILVAVFALSILPVLMGQAPDAVVEEGVQLRIEQQELAYLKKSGQLSAEEYAARLKNFQQRDRNYKLGVAKYPKDQQAALAQQVENRYAVVFPPLQQKWNAEALRLQEEAKALTAKRNKELEADALTAAQLQTERFFRQRQREQGTLSAAEATARDAADTAKITALQSTYAGYGGTWVGSFNRRVQQLTDQLVKERDLQERVADTTSEVGKDAHKASDLMISMSRNSVRRSEGAISSAQESQVNAPLKTALEVIQAKYVPTAALGASARDYNERVTTLVQKATRENRDQWMREARGETAVNRAPPAPIQPAINTDYLKEMPEAGRVLADHQGTDASDTVAKQWGALYQLRAMMELQSGGRNFRNQWTTDEEKVRSSYSESMAKLEQPKFDEEETRKLGANSPRAKWFDRRTKYELDKSFREEILKRYFSADWQNRFRALEQAQQQRLAMQQAREQMASPSYQTPAKRNVGILGWLITVAIVLGIPFLLFIRPIIRSYNGLVLLRNQTQKAWAQIDVQLKRRHDLISNFVETVKGYAKHERGTLEEVAKARSMAASATTVAEKAGAESALTATMKTLYAVVESYPDLKANQNFIALQASLTSTEDMVAASRQQYNDEVLEYNTRVQSFPTNLVATIFRFKVRDFFEVKSEAEREGVKASF